MSMKAAYLFHLRFYSSQVQTSVAVIKVPQYVKHYVEKAKRKKSQCETKELKKILHRGNTSIPIIKSTNREFNFYLGQIYNKFYPIPLQSNHWFKSKSGGQKFTIYPWDTNPALPINLSEDDKYLKSFIPYDLTQLNLNNQVIEAVKISGIASPTPIQTLAIPKIFEHNHMLIAAETGSGKTLSYVIPLLQQILLYKKEMKLFPLTPLALILVPGKELAEQIAVVCSQLASHLDINVKLLLSNSKLTKHENLIFHRYSNVDILVSPIGILNNVFKKGGVKLANLKHLILDEADTLLDNSFIDDITYLLKKVTIQDEYPKNGIKPHGAQLIFVSSTYPDNIASILPDDFSEETLTKVKSPYLHRILPHVRQSFWRVKHATRAGELLDLVKSDYKSKTPVLIFCNKSPTCDWMTIFLEENGVPNVCFHAGIEPEKRSEVYYAFREGDVNVMCCTDLASRGLDTQNVRHVINFDFPNNVSDYILRVGRVGRCGTNHGYVTSLINKPSGVYCLRNIEMAVRNATKIPDVNANIKKKINKLYFTY